MNVGVRYLAQLRQLVGQSLEPIELPGPCAVADLLAALAERHAALGPLLLDGEERPRPSVLVFVGDEQVSEGRLLAEGDEVTLLAPIAGGE